MIKRFSFRARDGGELPRFSGGAHVIVEMPDGEILRRNPYSLMSDPADPSRYAISVRRDEAGRGGSRFMHEKVREGMELTISMPVNMFPSDRRARKHLLLAGGIGITPFVPHILELAAAGAAFELHYNVRTREQGAYAEDLARRFGDRVHVYETDLGEGFDLDAILSDQPLGTHLYVCGPKGMITDVIGRASEFGWPGQNVHYEEFLAPQPGKPYQVELARSGITVEVASHQSLLEAIEAAGVDAPYLCRGGACGQCETAVVSCDGQILHNDHYLTDEEKASGEKIMVCVSRFEGRRLVIDR
ncbi:PDR/VanB family oxidoreductase [Lutibaculum baratangense]|nr:PDR/VanB family oxidoreductase [Lutibaculum baratangense]